MDESMVIITKKVIIPSMKHIREVSGFEFKRATVNSFRFIFLDKTITSLPKRKYIKYPIKKVVSIKKIFII